MKTYVAIGDSMSIDFYPAQDAEDAGLETREDIGAAALFYCNEPKLFPEFAGRDLKSMFGDIRYENHCVDGATCDDLLSTVRNSGFGTRTRSLVTLTIGGNDLLEAFRRSANSEDSFIQSLMDVKDKFAKVVAIVRRKFPDSTLMISTVFDPTDGTGIMPTASAAFSKELPIQYLHQFNDYIKAIAKKEGVLLADVHKHFLGHGAICGSADNFWYWKASPIEPSYKGASEIRRVWLDTLEQYAG